MKNQITAKVVVKHAGTPAQISMVKVSPDGGFRAVKLTIAQADAVYRLAQTIIKVGGAK